MGTIVVVKKNASIPKHAGTIALIKSSAMMRRCWAYFQCGSKGEKKLLILTLLSSSLTLIEFSAACWLAYEIYGRWLLKGAEVGPNE